MAPELRRRKSKTELAAPVEKPAKAAATKAAKSPKAEKRKANEDASPIVKKKQKPAKVSDVAASKKPVKEAEDKEETAVPKKSALKKEKPAKKAKEFPAVEKVAAEPQDQEVAAPSDGEEDEEVDVATEALVESLDSDNEDESSKKQVGTYKKGQPVGKAPTPKKGAKAAKDIASSGKPGVMYLGSIPHGFYEHEIREYFSQFGEITRLRVVRNKKTGASRHRAFVEFADAEVADIAARTMDSYLLFGHILKAKLVRPDQVHPELFKGANRRFNAVPWNAMVGRHLSRPLGESKWQGRVTKEEQRREARAEKLKALGYEFEAPMLKAPEAKAQIEGKENDEAKAVEAEEPPKQIEEAKPEKVEPLTSISQKEKKAKGAKGAKGKKIKA